jgi:hypothetical protein
VKTLPKQTPSAPKPVKPTVRAEKSSCFGKHSMRTSLFGSKLQRRQRSGHAFAYASSSTGTSTGASIGCIT